MPHPNIKGHSSYCFWIHAKSVMELQKLYFSTYIFWDIIFNLTCICNNMEFGIVNLTQKENDATKIQYC